MFFFNQPRWKKVEYSRTAIINAGKKIKRDDLTDDELKKATDIIDNWRAAHAYPLHVIYINLRRMAKNDINRSVIVAERLKRLDSIIAKLKREPTMSLWNMQDLGGCRVILPNLQDVYNYANKFEKSRIRHIKKGVNDYIKNPKSSGYRSYHVVYEYKSDKNEDYNKNMLVEIQFRTHLQHLWATAVETMGLFTKQAIKSGKGSDDIKRFFVLVSALFAIKEGCPLPPNVVDDIEEIIHELEAINAKNNYLDILSAIKVAVDFKGKINDNSNGYYLLILNYTKKTLNIVYFPATKIDEANTIYSQIESNRAESKIDAVLVRVTSFKELKSAYPNYFSDISEFVDIVKSYLE